MDRFYQRMQLGAKVHELTLWNSPEHWAEEHALRLLAVVPQARVLWGVRSDSGLESKAVQKAIFSMPHLTSLQCLQVSPKRGSEFDPSLLALAIHLRTVSVLSTPCEILWLSALESLPTLTTG